MEVINQKEYLKKYLSGGSKDGKKKKRKKKPVGNENVKIIDDDIDISHITSVEEANDLFSTNEDAPQIVGVIDDRPMHLRIDDYRKSNLWKPLGAEESSSTQTEKDSGPLKLQFQLGGSRLGSEMNKKDKHHDESPPRSYRNPEKTEIRKAKSSRGSRWDDENDSSRSRRNSKSPPRKSKDDDRSERYEDGSDTSPPRQRSRREEDKTPPRRNSLKRSKSEKHEESSPLRQKDKRYEDNTPPRRTRRDAANSPAPPRRTRRDSDNSSTPPRKTRRDSDNSPSGERRNSDSSPLRRNRRNSDNSSPQKNKHLDSSLPRKIRRHSDSSPPRKSRRNSDTSPPQQKNKKEEDCSPPRRKKDEDSSPPRKSRKTSDSTPPRRSRRNSDNTPPRQIHRRDDDSSPPRKRKGNNNDSSPPRRRKGNEDNSPPRRNRSPSRLSRRDDENKKEPVEPKRKLLPGDKKGKYLIPAKRGANSSTKMTKTLDGKTAGLQSVQHLIKENEDFRQREDDLFKNMSADVSGANAAAVVRDRKTGKIRDLQKEAEERREKEKREEENKEKYTRWGRGLKQVEDYEDKLAQDLHEMSKPLARYADDEDLERHLKEREREGDPMLDYIRKKKKKKDVETGKPAKPRYEGEFMPNRFGIIPGHRWDGVDRSNGYEKKWFEVQNAKRAQQEEIYKWSTEDM